MKCPHCNTVVSIEWYDSHIHANEDSDAGIKLSYGPCPNCAKLIVALEHGKVEKQEYGFFISQVDKEEIVYPIAFVRPIEPEVPDKYRQDYSEACAVLSLSPKASAALSRRVLQNVLREQFKISHRSLAQEIDDFIKLPGIPTYLKEAIDAIRNVGNLAAHPLKDTHTGEIVDVEPGEADWLLEVLETLFDFAFVQPKRLQERQRKLNAKLAKLGKPPMKK